jgi:hypothetical protein
MTLESVNQIFPKLQRQIATDTGAGFVDAWSAMGGKSPPMHPPLTCDGCHPDDAGLSIIAAAIAAAL